MQKLFSRILKQKSDLIYYMFSNIASKMISGISGIFLARYLSNFDYGMLATITAFTGFLFIIINFGMLEYCLLEFSKNNVEIESLLGKILPVFILFYIIGGFILCISYNVLYDYGFFIALLLYFKLFFNWLISGVIFILQSKNLFNRVSFIQVTVSFSVMLSVGLLYIFKFNLEKYVVVTLILTGIISIFLIKYINSKYLNISKLLKNVKLFEKSIIKNSYYFFLSAFMAYIYTQSDVLMLGFMIGPVEVSKYAVTTVLLFAAYLIPMSVSNYYIPKLTKAYSAKNKNELKSLYNSFKNIIVTVMFLISVFIFLFSENILKILYGGKYIDSNNILKILSLVLFIHSLCVIYGTVLTISGNQKLKSKLQTVLAILNIVLNLFFIPIYGAEGAAATTLMTEVAMFGIYYYFSKKYIKSL